MGGPRLPRITLRQFRNIISSGAVTVPEVAAYCRRLAVAGEDVLELNAFTSIAAEEKIQDEASKAQKRWDSGTQISPLDGVPVCIKANLAIAEYPLTAGSAVLGAAAGLNETPAIGYTADVVRSLQGKGAIVMGITHMDEFGMGSLGTNMPSGKATKNPLSFFDVDEGQNGDDADFVAMVRSEPGRILEIHEKLATGFSTTPFSAGGSSCGSAASVAHGSSLLGLGSDTGGSVRLPAAWCGLSGIRPTYGRLSRHGLVSYASSFDTIGMLANSSDCIGLALSQSIHYNDPSRDSTLSAASKDFEWPTCCADTPHPLSGLKVGIPEAFSVAECRPEVREAWSRAADLVTAAGATVDTIPESVISPRVLQTSLAAYFILVCAEASSNLARYDGFRYGVNVPNAVDQWEADAVFTLLEHQYASARTSGFGHEVIRRILCGTAALSSDRFHSHYEGAARLRADLTEQLRSALVGHDMLLVPTVLFPPPALSTKVDPTEVFANDVMTIPASLAGLPAVSVPVKGATSDRFPCSIQLIGRSFEEQILLKAATVLE